MALVAGGFSGGGKSSAFVGKTREIGYEEETVVCNCIFKPKDPLKKNKAQLLKERIRQFSIWYYENEEQREEQHVKRRFGRESKRMERRKHGVMRVMRFYLILTATVALIGSVFTLCSTVKALGEYTFMYKKKHVYRILGPGLLVLSTIMYFLATAIKHKNTKSTRPKRSFYIVEKKSNDKGKAPPVSRGVSIETVDSGNVEDIEMQTMPKRRPIVTQDKLSDDAGMSGAVVRTGFALNQEQLQDNFDLEDVSYESSHLASDAWHGRTDKRRAWAKSKWMRLEQSQDSVTDSESLDNFPSDPVHPKSSVEELSNPKYGAGGVMPSSLLRDMSVRSKDSTSTNFSTQSETHPLIGK